MIANRIRPTLRRFIAAVEPWYDWGRIYVSRFDTMSLNGDGPMTARSAISNCNGSGCTSRSMSGVCRRRGAADMAARHFTGTVPGAFDPAAWLADWSDHGGLVAMVGDRLWIGRASGLDRRATQRLDSIRGAIMRPDAGNALAGVLRGFPAGEA